MSSTELTVADRLRKIIVQLLSVEESNSIQDTTRFIEDLNADSLDMIELVMDIEDEFDVSITDEEAEKVETFEQAVAMIEKAIGKQGGR